MLLKINDSDLQDIKDIIIKMMKENNINYGFNLRIDIKGKEITFKWDGIRF